MNLKHNRPLVIGGLLLVAAFAISLAWLLIATNSSVERVIFFPGHIDPVLHGESRVVPRYRDPDRDVRVLVEEIVLGPTVMGYARVVPRDLSIRALMVRDGIAYIDFDSEILFSQEGLNLTLEQALESIRHTVRYNFRRIRNVVITIEGQIPGQPVYELSMRYSTGRIGNGKYALTNGFPSL